MKLTAFNIKKQEFNRAVRGYDKDEVRAFLDKLADEFELLSYENERLKKDLQEMQEQITAFKKIEKNLQNTLLSATESSSKAVESTKKQTALMLKESEIKSAQIIEKAREEANSIRDSVLKLREERKLLIARIKAMISSQESLLNFNLSGSEKLNSDYKIMSGGKSSKEINVDDIVEKLL